MSKQTIKIIATTESEFKSITKQLSPLSEGVRGQICSAQQGAVGLECFIKQNYNKTQRIYLPAGVTQIANFDDYIGIYCGNYFFKIERRKDDNALEYIFEQPAQKKIS